VWGDNRRYFQFCRGSVAIVPQVFNWAGDFSMSSIGFRSRGAAHAPGAIPYSTRHRRRASALLLASAVMTPAFGKGSSTPPGHRHTTPHGSASSDVKHHTHERPSGDERLRKIAVEYCCSGGISITLVTHRDTMLSIKDQGSSATLW
jgi:hypothetical protein